LERAIGNGWPWREEIGLTSPRHVPSIISFIASSLPQVLASIRALFPPDAQGRALDFYGAALGLATICGQILGGDRREWPAAPG
jgi:MFS family permease